MEIQIKRYTRIQGDSDTEIYTETGSFRYRDLHGYIEIQIQRYADKWRFQAVSDSEKYTNTGRFQRDFNNEKYTGTGRFRCKEIYGYRNNTDTEKYMDTGKFRHREIFGYIKIPIQGDS